ncbi:MAG: ATP-binding protein [Treponema sp.]|nr:ATP-binding protein [Treponema sp.]
MSNSYNFLENRSITSLRKEINNIINSYSNSWDILSELTQNSVDAIKRYNISFPNNNREHEIEIKICVPGRTISIRDTGIGIEASKVKDVVAPNGTDKEEENDSIGEKGVGLTYTIFSCNEFSIKTQNTESFFEGSINSASIWRIGATSKIPELTIKQEKSTEHTEKTFTEIELSDIDKNTFEADDLFNQTPEVLIYILRTKTVIGYLKGVFGETQPNIKVTLKYVDLYNKEHKFSIPFKYLLPEEFCNKKVIELNEFKQKAATYDDKQKSQKLAGNALVKKSTRQYKNHSINYYCFFAPTRLLWADICEKNNYYITESNQDKVPLVTAGIYIATKGMPTGIIIEPPTTGYAGYWGNFFILLEDDYITFDLGRKTVPSRTKGLFKEIAKELFTEFLPFIKYVSSDPAVRNINATVQANEKQKIYDNMKNCYANLGLDCINYQKNPNGQEAAVVALFHELVGAGILKGYKSLSTGYKQTYDLWANYQISTNDIGKNIKSMFNDVDTIDLPCVIEFKFAAQSIIDDLTADIKFFTDMDLLVCWDFDEQALSKNSVEVTPLEKDDVLFYGSNYLLKWPGSYNLGAASEKPLLSLRQFIEKLKQQ